jgi:hypothetical protein
MTTDSTYNMSILQRDINSNNARLINNGIQADYDTACDRKGIARTDLSKDTPKSQDKPLDKPKTT